MDGDFCVKLGWLGEEEENTLKTDLLPRLRDLIRRFPGVVEVDLEVGDDFRYMRGYLALALGQPVEHCRSFFAGVATGFLQANKIETI